MNPSSGEILKKTCRLLKKHVGREKRKLIW